MDTRIVRYFRWLSARQAPPERIRAFYLQEIQYLFEQYDLELIVCYGNRIAIRSLPEEIQNLTDFDEEFFSQIAQLELHCSEDPSLLGIAEYLQVVGLAAGK